MGFTYRPKIIYGTPIEVGPSEMGGTVTLTTVAANKDMCLRFVIPTNLDGSILASFLDLQVGEVSNTSAGANFTDTAQTIRIIDLSIGGAETTMFSDFSDRLYCPATGTYTMPRMYGDINGGALLKGVTYEVDLMGGQAAANNLVLYNITGVLRLYIG